MNPVLFENFKSNEGAIALYQEGLLLLKQSGILEILQDASRVKVARPENSLFVDIQAAYANQAIGYTEALDDLLYFKDKYLIDATPQTTKAEADYGAVDIMLAKGDITQEEYDLLRSGKSIEEVFSRHDSAAFKKLREEQSIKNNTIDIKE